MNEGMPPGKTAAELQATYREIKAQAEQDLRDLNTGRVRAPEVRLHRVVRRIALWAMRRLSDEEAAGVVAERTLRAHLFTLDEDNWGERVWMPPGFVAECYGLESRTWYAEAVCLEAVARTVNAPNNQAHLPAPAETVERKETNL